MGHTSADVIDLLITSGLASGPVRRLQSFPTSVNVVRQNVSQPFKHMKLTDLGFGNHDIIHKATGNSLTIEVSLMDGQKVGRIYDTYHPLSYLEQYYAVKPASDPSAQSTSDVTADGDSAGIPFAGS
jgi:hypothetical protein